MIRFRRAGVMLIAVIVAAQRDAKADPAVSGKSNPAPERMVLAPDQWDRLDRAVDRGLAHLASRQESDGSFPTVAFAQPGVTALCVMAFLARGHQPGAGPYGRHIERAVDFTLGMQGDDGAIMPEKFAANENFAGNYSHGIAGVMLAEVYGMTSADRHERIRRAVVKGLEYSRRKQTERKYTPGERGGWRYRRPSSISSDLSVTAWHLMFYRAARNAEFVVPPEWVAEAMGYVRRSFDDNERTFVYGLHGRQRYVTRGMAGAGIVALELGGEHQSAAAKLAGDWILSHSFDRYNEFRHPEDRYHYGAFYCSQAMFQLGGDYWQRFFPGVVAALADAQHADGSWDVESVSGDERFGNAYTTALAILALATPYQMLPIYQR